MVRELQYATFMSRLSMVQRTQLSVKTEKPVALQGTRMP
jgi:hypothetical protein